MERVTLEGGVTLSRLVYGTWRMAEDSDTSAKAIRDKVSACLDHGMTSFDHADIYGGYAVEELFGSALAGTGLIDRIEIVTKCGIVAPVGRHVAARLKHYDTSPDHIRASVDASLRLLGRDHVDLLLIHRPDPFMDFHATGQALDGLVAAGKVRAVGVSNFRPWDMAALQAAMRTPLATNQIEVSLKATDPLTNGDIVDLQRLGLPPMAWSPLGGGDLMTGAGPLQALMDDMAARYGTDRAGIALAFLLAHPARIVPVIGTNSIARMIGAAGAAKIRLDRQDWFGLLQAARGFEVP